MQLIYLYGYVLVIFFVGLWPFNFWQTNQVTISKDAGITLKPPSMAYTKVALEKLSHPKQFTIFLDVKPKEKLTNNYARILTYSIADNGRNFMVAQWQDSLVFLLKAGHKKNLIHLEKEGLLKENRRARFAITYGEGKLTLYNDGIKIKELMTGPLEFSSWNGKYPLSIGCEADGTYCWSGSIYDIAIFGRAYSHEETIELSEKIQEWSPLVWYRFGESKGRYISDMGSGIPANLFIPRRFVPYNRSALDIPRGNFVAYRYYFMDLFVNIIGFIPLGFLMAAYLILKRASLKRIAVVSTAVGMVLSLIIELLQVFLPTRSSSLLDVMMNTMGALLGAFISLVIYSYKRKESVLAEGGEEEVISLAGLPDPTLKRIPAQTIMDIMSRHTLFLFFTLVSVAMFYDPLRALLRTYAETDLYLHIILIPLVSGYLIYEKKATIFSKFSYSWKAGIPLLIVGSIAFFYAKNNEFNFNKNDYASFVTFSAAVFWAGSFLLVYGVHEFRAMLFPLTFLIFMIPMPSAMMDGVIAFLRYGSTALVDIFFKLIGTSFVREDFVFYLPGITIEVAPQCSGINSSYALFIIGIIASHLFLNNKWKKAAVIVSIIPIVMVKNALRIVTLSMLGTYVDVKYLTQGFLHQSGGFLFYIPALILIIGLTWVLGKTVRQK